MKHTHISPSFAGLLVLVLALTAATQAAKFPTGVISGSDGTVTIALDFDTTGAVNAYVDNQPFSSGRYETKADTVTFGAITGPEGYSCAGSGKYLWAFADSRMSFTMLTDECQIRIQTLTGLVWTRGS
jgi:hypothetical protein